MNELDGIFKLIGISVWVIFAAYIIGIVFNYITNLGDGDNEEP